MPEDFVYCPKCGNPSASTLRFCTKCGTNLEAVSRALTGQLPATTPDALATEMEIEYAKEFSRSLYQLFGSLTVFGIMFFMFRGQWWVFFMLFWVASCVRDLIQATILRNSITNPAAFQAALQAFREEKHGKGKRRRRERREQRERDALNAAPTPVSVVVPVDEGAYIPPARTTGELSKPDELVFDPDRPPASVTEGTTRLLEEDAEPAESRPPVVRERQ